MCVRQLTVHKPGDPDNADPFAEFTLAQKDIFPVTGPAAAGQILPFYLAGENGDGALIRGRLASVGGPASSILARHGYPEMVASLQAEALAIAACLSTFMKFDGVFTLQALSLIHI